MGNKKERTFSLLSGSFCVRKVLFDPNGGHDSGFIGMLQKVKPTGEVDGADSAVTMPQLKGVYIFALHPRMSELEFHVEPSMPVGIFKQFNDLWEKIGLTAK